MEIETQRQSAFFLLVSHGNRFVEEILAPPLFIRFGACEKARFLVGSGKGTTAIEFCSVSAIPRVETDLTLDDVYATGECFAPARSASLLESLKWMSM